MRALRACMCLCLWVCVSPQGSAGAPTPLGYALLGRTCRPQLRIPQRPIPRHACKYAVEKKGHPSLLSWHVSGFDRKWRERFEPRIPYSFEGGSIKHMFPAPHTSWRSVVLCLPFFGLRTGVLSFPPSCGGLCSAQPPLTGHSLPYEPSLPPTAPPTTGGEEKHGTGSLAPSPVIHSLRRPSPTAPIPTSAPPVPAPPLPRRPPFPYDANQPP